MDATIKNNPSQEFAERIKASLEETQHRFEIQDPFNDTKLIFNNAEAVIAKAEELGFTAFKNHKADKSVTQVSKVDGVWQSADGKPLSEIQAQIDLGSSTAIYTRAEQRVLAGQGVDAKTDKEMALADAYAYQRIQNPEQKTMVAVLMAENTREYPDYKEGLETAFTGYTHNPPQPSKVAESVTALVKAYEDNKELTATATTPETQPATQEAAIDPAALERVAQNRARDFEAARIALGLNAIEPNIEKEQQPLDSENEAKRNAWLKKADEAPKPEPAKTKNAGDNTVESDEVFTATQDIKPIVPPDIEQRYLRVGDKYYHPKNTEMVAFEDKGNKLETKSNSENIVESMVRIAEARGWDEIKVSGSETFRREVWLEAASRGMHIRGYTPTEQDKAVLEKRIGETEANKVEKDYQTNFRARENTEKEAANTPGTSANLDNTADKGKSISGVLVEHGAAKYLNDEKNTESYFVTTKDDKGKEKTSWGVDLARAIAESGAQPGNKINIVNEGQKQVIVNVPIRDENGVVIATEPKDVKRNAWNVQLAEAFASNSPVDAVKQHPELAGAAAIAVALDKKAEADGLTPEQRHIVAARVKENIVNSIERGNIPKMNIKDEHQISLNQERDLSR